MTKRGAQNSIKFTIQSQNNKFYEHIRILFLIIGISIISLIGVKTYINTEYATQGNYLYKLEQEQKYLMAENIKIREQIAELNNIERIETEAQTQGFRKIEKDEIKYIEIK